MDINLYSFFRVNGRNLYKSAQIEPINSLLKKAAQLKCRRAIAVTDCLTIALAELIKGKAIFYHKEKELENTMENESFNIEIIFFDEFNNKNS